MCTQESCENISTLFVLLITKTEKKKNSHQSLIIIHNIQQEKKKIFLNSMDRQYMYGAPFLNVKTNKKKNKVYTKCLYIIHNIYYTVLYSY